MQTLKTTYNRRSFFKVSASAGGGIVFGFSWLASCAPSEEMATAPSEWFDINAFLSIADNGQVTIMSPNPEIGQNVKTSMPMIVAEELDVAWKNVIVRQAPLSKAFTRQVAGGSGSLRSSWQGLRMAGATARHMLVQAAANRWQVDASTLTTSEGMIHRPDGEKLSYAEVAAEAVNVPVPEEVPLKDPKDFKIIGTSQKNVDIDDIITGKPLFGLDQRKPGMLYASILRPPAFGQKLESFDDTETRGVSGVSDVIQFGDKIAVLANTTWGAMKGKNALQAQWITDSAPENSTGHNEQMLLMLDKPAEKPERSDGDVRSAFAEADQVLERTYEAPFLPHNCMEPMNFYANVTADKAELSGPIQTPERTLSQVAEAIGLAPELISIDLTRMGGGFGRRLYGDFAIEAAEVSQKAQKPVMVVYSREDDMTAGIYRPSTKYKFRAALKEGKLTGYHLTGAGINTGNTTRQNNFPATALANYLVESHRVDSNITTGAWRAPITNFLAYAEQSFLDEIAEQLGQDPVQFRLDLFEEAKSNPIGELDYDIDKFVGVIKLAAEKSNWSKMTAGVYQGFSAYYAHRTYVAEVANVVMQNGKPKVQKIICAADCGIVVNPDAAVNMMEGGVVDGIGHAMYGDFSFENGMPRDNNFNTYRMIRMSESPEVEAYFVQNTNDPTGLGEPSLPPAGGAVANAIYKATGQRLYSQPFVKRLDLIG